MSMQVTQCIDKLKNEKLSLGNSELLSSSDHFEHVLHYKNNYPISAELQQHVHIIIVLESSLKTAYIFMFGSSM